MKLKELMDELQLTPIHLEDGEIDIAGVYCGDLLSDVLAHLEPDCVWFTVQGHMNVAAVASLRDAAAVVLTNGTVPDPETVAKAQAMGVSLCGSDESAAALCMKLAGRL